MKFVRIPEHAIENAAAMMEQLDGGQENSFTSILNKIAVFKQAEMTPLVLMDPANYTVYVVSEETFMKKLH
jgi:hypothetical protein